MYLSSALLLPPKCAVEIAVFDSHNPSVRVWSLRYQYLLGVFLSLWFTCKSKFGHCAVEIAE